MIFCDGDEYEKIKSATKDLQVTIVTMRNHPKGSVRIQDVLTTPVMQNFQPLRLKDGIDHTLAILSSSGTSGFPKAVTISNSHKIIVDYM